MNRRSEHGPEAHAAHRPAHHTAPLRTLAVRAYALAVAVTHGARGHGRRIRVRPTRHYVGFRRLSRVMARPSGQPPTASRPQPTVRVTPSAYGSARERPTPSQAARARMRLGPLDDHRGGPPTRRGSRSSSRRPRREHPGFPTGTATDLAYAAAAAGVSAVPVVGGPAVELVQAVFGPPLAKRQQRWFEELADAVRILQGHDVPLDSAEFVTAVTQASRIALGTHLDEKIAMLKAAIIHAAFPDRPTDIITARFLRFVDELDPEHFVLLAYLHDPAGHFVSNNIPKPNVLMGGTGSIFAEAAPDPAPRHRSRRSRRARARGQRFLEHGDDEQRGVGAKEYGARQPAARLRDLHRAARRRTRDGLMASTFTLEIIEPIGRSTGGGWARLSSTRPFSKAVTAARGIEVWS